MTYKEIAAMIAEIAEAVGCEYHYYDEGEREVVKTPYLLFDYPNRDDFGADDQNYAHVQRLNIEYDSQSKEIDTEAKIEAILNAHELYYTKEDTRFEGQNAYEVMYSMEVTING